MKSANDNSPDPETAPRATEDRDDVTLRRVSEAAICPACGPTRAVSVGSQLQCEKCGRVLADCCDGQ
jgi:hypothetical protein